VIWSIGIRICGSDELSVIILFTNKTEETLIRCDCNSEVGLIVLRFESWNLVICQNQFSY
jgi:hypothetical protein